ncbi:hypothetical protein BDV18DRAFT_144587 [Aspergillus unguis]
MSMGWASGSCFGPIDKRTLALFTCFGRPCYCSHQVLQQVCQGELKHASIGLSRSSTVASISQVGGYLSRLLQDITSLLPSVRHWPREFAVTAISKVNDGFCYELPL